MELNTSLDKMTSSSEVLTRLKEKGLDREFSWSGGKFSTPDGKTYQPGDLRIVKTFRFEGASNPDDSEILYIIETREGMIGYSQDVYGPQSSDEHGVEYGNFIRQIPVTGHNEQLPFEL